MSHIDHGLIAERAYKAIVAESARLYPLETGGVLIGEVADSEIRILTATGPGPNATHKRSLFQRNGASSQQTLDEIVAASNGAIDYLGEWHSHPADVGPSAMDVSSMKWIANNPRYSVESPILGLCIRKAHKSWQFYLFELAKGKLIPIPVRVVPLNILVAQLRNKF